jgi:hypothetical protein
MRLAAGGALIGQAVPTLQTDPAVEPAILYVLAAVAGLLLLAGLWTPIAGMLVALFELWNTFARLGDPWAKILVGVLALALALLGPGAWSIDAWLFGWKRIDIRVSERSGTQKSVRDAR